MKLKIGQGQSKVNQVKSMDDKIFLPNCIEICPVVFLNCIHKTYTPGPAASLEERKPIQPTHYMCKLYTTLEIGIESLKQFTPKALEYELTYRAISFYVIGKVHTANLRP
jgi:hypothetical protein